MTSFTSSPEAFGLPALMGPARLLAQNPRLINSRLVDAQVAVAVAPLRHAPDTQSGALSYLLYGEPLQILGETGPWQLVVSVIDGYLGWLEQTHLCSLHAEPTHHVTAPLTHIYSDANLKSRPIGTLPLGAFVSVTGSSDKGYLSLAQGGWLFAKHTGVIGDSQNDPVTIAEQYSGTPYLWGGRSYMGIDCSGLIQVSLAACGLRVHRDSGPQFESLGELLPDTEKPQRGDLVFFPGHVGWMVDDRHVLHANATHMAVTTDNVTDVTRWVAAQTDKPPFKGYKRLPS